MALKIEFLDGARSGEILEFGDDIDSIQIGRDPQRCKVVIPPDVTTVGREHCTLSRVRGRYYMEMAAEKKVTLEGNLMDTVQAIPEDCVIQIGPGGPKLRVMTVRADDMAATMQQGIDPEQLHRRSATAATTSDVEEVRANAQQSGQVAGVAILIGALLIVVIGVLYFSFSGEVQDLEDTQAINTETVEDLSESMSAMGADLPAALEKASRSTYLVVLRNPDGSEEPFGTAWVSGKGRLATNAHVAERVEQLADGQEVILRSMAGEKEFKAIASKSHPGYDEFADLWTDYVPMQINAVKDSDPIRSAGIAADVGFIYVDEDADLGSPLVLADLESQDGLKAGDPVGYVGYPVENMALGGVNLNKPVPQSQIGRITAITNYFNAPEEGADGLLLQHSLPATGGASGSPLINSDGEVVGLLSAVNFMVVGGKRIPNAASVNFAQRSTLLDELSSPDLATMQTRRSDRWQDQIGTLYASGQIENREPGLDDLVSSWENMISTASEDEIVTGSTEVSAERFPLNSLNINPLAMGAGDALGAQMYGKQIEMRVEAGRDYLLAVEGDGTVGVKITEGENGIRSVNVMNIKPNLKAIAFKAQRSGTIKAAVGGSDINGSISYELRSADVAPSTPDTVAKAAARRWIRDLSRSGGRSFNEKLAQQFQGSLENDSEGQSASRNLSLSSAGQWFIVGICPEHEHLHMVVMNENGDTLAEDMQPDWYPFVALDADAPMSVKARLSSPKKADGSSNSKSSYRLFVYQAVPSGG
tara:strand:- start:36429 stop:38711 length:2283 start_codon:yes stop_codon:yes gene_type:complete